MGFYAKETESSKGSFNFACEVLEATLEFIHCAIERLLGGKAAIGLKGEHIGVFNLFEGDGVIEVAVATSPWSNLVKSGFEVHHVIDIGEGLVLAE